MHRRKLKLKIFQKRELIEDFCCHFWMQRPKINPQEMTISVKERKMFLNFVDLCNTRSIYCTQSSFLVPCSFFATGLIRFSVALITSTLTKNPAVVVAFT